MKFFQSLYTIQALSGFQVNLYYVKGQNSKEMDLYLIYYIKSYTIMENKHMLIILMCLQW